MFIEVDRTIYTDECISKTIYALSDRYTFVRRQGNDIEHIEVMGTVSDESCFKRLFYDNLNDFKLRGIIEEQTRDIRTLLYAKAFMNCDDEE